MLDKFRITNILSLAILCCIAGLSGCNPQDSENNPDLAKNKPKVVASHNILCDLVTTIALDTVDLTCLIEGDSDPHSYRPTPFQRRAMEEAELILYGGYQLEPQIVQLIEATSTSVPEIAVYEEVVAKPILSEHTEEELEPDPHVWHDVQNVVAMVKQIQPLLSQINNSESPQYQQNSSALLKKLDRLDNWVNQQISTIPQDKRILVTTHDSFNYYVRAYPIEEYKTLQGLSAESSPTASQVKDLALEIRQTGIPTIFVEAKKSDRVMNNVARAANVEIASENLFADGLGEANSYVEMISHNTCVIVNGLEGKCQAFE